MWCGLGCVAGIEAGLSVHARQTSLTSSFVPLNEGMREVIALKDGGFSLFLSPFCSFAVCTHSSRHWLNVIFW